MLFLFTDSAQHIVTPDTGSTDCLDDYLDDLCDLMV